MQHIFISAFVVAIETRKKGNKWKMWKLSCDCRWPVADGDDDDDDADVWMRLVRRNQLNLMICDCAVVVFQSVSLSFNCSRKRMISDVASAISIAHSDSCLSLG